MPDDQLHDATLVSYHDGVKAPGKNANHLFTSSSCEACHATLAWSPVIRVDHAEVQGNCSICHNGTTAAGKPSGHFVTTLECDQCHTTNAWAPASYSHTSVYYPNGGSHVGQPCSACHIGNSQTNVWTTPAYQPDCAGCHAADFRLDKHQGQGLGAA